MNQWKATVINQVWNTNGLERGKEVTQWELFGLWVKDEFQVPRSNSWKRNRTSIICEREGKMGPKDGVRKTSLNHTENKCECPCSIPSVGKRVPNLYPTQIWILPDMNFEHVFPMSYWMFLCCHNIQTCVHYNTYTTQCHLYVKCIMYKQLILELLELIILVYEFEVWLWDMLRKVNRKTTSLSAGYQRSQKSFLLWWVQTAAPGQPSVSTS